MAPVQDESDDERAIGIRGTTSGVSLAESHPENHSEPFTAAQYQAMTDRGTQSQKLAKPNEHYNKMKKAARRLLLFYYKTNRQQCIEWDPNGTYAANENNPEKNEFHAEMIKKRTLEDIIDIGFDVCDKEPDNYSRASHVAHFVARKTCFLVNENGESGTDDLRYYSHPQILKLVEEEVSELDRIQKWEEQRVERAVRDDGYFREITDDQFPGQREYKREKYINLRSLTPPSKRSRASIDFVFGVHGGLVFLEVDESQHASYKENYDMERMYDVMRAYKNGGNTLPVLWIRFNPDKFLINKEQPKISKKTRIKMLIEYLRDMTLDGEPPLQVKYAFYNDDILVKRASFDEAFRKASTFIFRDISSDSPEDVESSEGDEDELNLQRLGQERMDHVDNMFTGPSGGTDSQESVLGE